MVAEGKCLHEHIQRYMHTYIYIYEHIYICGSSLANPSDWAFFSTAPYEVAVSMMNSQKIRLCTDKGQRRIHRWRIMNDCRETKLEYILGKRNKGGFSHTEHTSCVFVLTICVIWANNMNRSEIHTCYSTITADCMNSIMVYVTIGWSKDYVPFKLYCIMR